MSKVPDGVRMYSKFNGGRSYVVKITFLEPEILNYLNKIFYEHINSPEFDYPSEEEKGRFENFYEKFKKHYKALDKP